MGVSYFWDDKAKTVLTSNSDNYWGTAKHNNVLDMYCMDSGCINPHLRYGLFSSTLCCWEHIPLDKFPKEFRAYLLLIT